jgi:hypothetical protein
MLKKFLPALALSQLAVIPAQATIYTSTTSPFDLSLNTGSYNWQTNVATVSSTDTTTLGTYHYGPVTVVSAPLVEVLDPQVGVPGYVKVYTDNTTTEYDQDYVQRHQGLDFSYSDSIADELTSPSSFLLSGSIGKQEGTDDILDSGFLYFDMGLSASFESDLAANGVDGTLTFEVGNSDGDWLYAFTTDFDSAFDSISLFESQYLDFSDDIYFQATYDVIGSDGTPFYLDDLYLDVFAGETDTTFSSNYNVISSTEEVVLSLTEMAALPPSEVPVPAAAWLFGSALLGLGSMKRRQKARSTTIQAVSN